MGIEHFLVMFPSTLIIANQTRITYSEPIISLASILFVCGIGTLLFLILTKWNKPFFLGPSFSYIVFTNYYVTKLSSVTPIDEIRSYLLWGYLLASISFIVMSLLYRFSQVRRIIMFLFPDVVMGPAISLIGLGLTEIAVEHAGLKGPKTEIASITLSILTLLVIIIASLTKRRFMKNASVFVGVLFGCVLAYSMHVFQLPELTFNPIGRLPPIYAKSLLNIPDNVFGLFLSVLPSVIIVFSESLGRIAVYSGMLKRDFPDQEVNNEKLTSEILVAHSLANLGTVLTGAMPNTIYAENLAIMNLNNTDHYSKEYIKTDKDSVIVEYYSPYSKWPYIIASAISIIVSCIVFLQDFFKAIPLAVLGGVELFIFGLISAPGIQLLVEQRVNYKKVSNQIITASVLLAGISNISVNLRIVELKGMSLGLTVGVVLNLTTEAFKRLGILNERLTLMDIINICLDCYSEKVSLQFTGSNMQYRGHLKEQRPEEVKDRLKRDENFIRTLDRAEEIEFMSVPNRKIVRIRQRNGKISMLLKFSKEDCVSLCNDYNHIIEISNQGDAEILIDNSISERALRKIMKKTV